MDKIKPTYWMTFESARRLERGGNCKGAVPVHGKPSVTAKIPLYDKSAIDTLRAEVEAHKTRADFWQLAKSSDFHRDAMRYRWLRSTGLSHINFEGLTCDTCDVGLDYAIDAAMQGDA